MSIVLKDGTVLPALPDGCFDGTPYGVITIGESGDGSGTILTLFSATEQPAVSIPVDLLLYEGAEPSIAVLPGRIRAWFLQEDAWIGVGDTNGEDIVELGADLSDIAWSNHDILHLTAYNANDYTYTIGTEIAYKSDENYRVTGGYMTSIANEARRLVDTTGSMKPDEVESTLKSVEASVGSGNGNGMSVQANYAQNDSTAADYIKNRPCYAEVGETLHEETVTIEEINGMLGGNLLFDIYAYYGYELTEDSTDEEYVAASNALLNKAFIVTIDGVTYGSSFKELNVFGEIVYGLGNPMIFYDLIIEIYMSYGYTREEALELMATMYPNVEATDTGESFLMITGPGGASLVVSYASEEVEVVIQEGIVKKLDRMFLPDNLGSKPEMGDVLPKVTEADEGKVLMVVDGAWAISPIAYGDEVAY